MTLNIISMVCMQVTCALIFFSSTNLLFHKVATLARAFCFTVKNILKIRAGQYFNINMYCNIKKKSNNGDMIFKHVSDIPIYITSVSYIDLFVTFDFVE